MIDRTFALLRDIDIFLGLTDMKPTTFGINAINDPSLYRKLSNGRRLYIETETRIRDYMEGYVRVKKSAA